MKKIIKNMKSHFYNKTILITGHTGFKGSWLSLWLANLGAKVIGLSNDVPTNPSHYDIVKSYLNHDERVNIVESNLMIDRINQIKPDFLFHLAAQPIVLESYKNPLETINTNTIGTANVLEGLRKSNHKCIAIMITSDKCYDNVEWTYGYRETDRLGGKDIYSGSKGAAEIVIRSYVESFFRSSDSNVRIAVGRAGNVIGGGDWAPHRIVPDCIRSWADDLVPEIRSPFATRPWQHVLEPLSGYLTLAIKLDQNYNFNGEAYNFGPSPYQNFSVGDLVDEIIKSWPHKKWIDKSAEINSPHEAGLLKLNCDKALHSLNWKATLNFEETAKWTSEWYYNYYKNPKKFTADLTLSQINDYMKIANERKSFSFGD